ncbi:MAG: Arc family DNA-binding protein [Thiofilum sp.]|uniref:FitA-like ribbon-helix-helix domain-containing protein n=1 Tax=Thiofilum sp. TaxID=2212733 RepID=UPI0029F0CB71|nr:Arc family DNA-binding protein [Thiofilum sp.]
MTNKDTEIRTQIRIPKSVHTWLADRAKQNDRSMNAELVRILRERMEAEKQAKDAA